MFALFFGIGLFLILLDVLKVPTKRANKVYLAVSKKGIEKSNALEVIILELSEKVGRFIKLGNFKKRKLIMTLRSANIKLTPEVFIAQAYVKAGIVLLGIVPAVLILPLLAPVLLITAILVLFKELGSADEKLKRARKR